MVAYLIGKGGGERWSPTSESAVTSMHIYFKSRSCKALVAPCRHNEQKYMFCVTTSPRSQVDRLPALSDNVALQAKPALEGVQYEGDCFVDSLDTFDSAAHEEAQQCSNGRHTWIATCCVK
jgi:hypothetical protein